MRFPKAAGDRDLLVLRSHASCASFQDKSAYLMSVVGHDTDYSTYIQIVGRFPVGVCDFWHDDKWVVEDNLKMKL